MAKHEIDKSNKKTAHFGAILFLNKNFRKFFTPLCLNYTMVLINEYWWVFFEKKLVRDGSITNVTI